MRAVLAGGGTGGHVIPALAIAKELQNLYQAEVLFIGTARGMETRLVPAAGYPLELIKVGQLNRVSLATRVRTLVDLPMSVVHSARLAGEVQAAGRDWRGRIRVGTGDAGGGAEGNPQPDL